MTQEQYINEVESAVSGLKVLEIKSEEGNPYSGIMYEYKGTRFQFVGVKIKKIELSPHLEELKYQIKKLFK